MLEDTYNNQENETTDQTGDEMSKSDLTFEQQNLQSKQISEQINELTNKMGGDMLNS